MAAILTTVQQLEYDQLVHAIYANNTRGKNLRQMVRNRTNFRGDSIQWRKRNYVTMEPGAFYTVVPYSDITFSPVEDILEKYILAVPIDDIEQFTVDFDTRSEVASACTDALKRREDQIVINANIASATTNTIANGGENLNFTKLRQIAEFFDDLGVPVEDRHFIISAQGSSSLLTQAQLTSNDYIERGAISKGSVDGSNVMSLNMHVIPTMAEGGLGKVLNIRTAWAFHTNALGYAARDFGSRIDEIPREDVWQVKMKTYACCIAVDATGIVQVDYDESA